MFQNVLTDERSRDDLDVAVGCKAITPSGESHAEVSLIGQAFPVQPSVPASWDRVGDMRFHVKSFNEL